MDSNGRKTMESSLEKIKKQLTSASGKHLLQGPLLKRSETLRKWNERWVILDPTTGKMEYKIKRTDAAVKGSIIFDSTSSISLSPLNFHGLPKYDGCCFYIGTPLKKEYFLCAETPGAARAWVSTLHATQLVLRAHKEAVNNIGTGTGNIGTVSTVVSAANSTALEASREIDAALKISLQNALGLSNNNNNNVNNNGSSSSRMNDAPLDSLTIMKETLRVKDEEIQNLSKDLRTKDSIIREIAEKLTETASAAESAAQAALSIDQERKKIFSEIVSVKNEAGNQIESSLIKLREMEERVRQLSKEKEELLKQRDSAVHEAHLWRSELAKARDQAVLLEASVIRAEERARVSTAGSETRVREAEEKVERAIKEKEELLKIVNSLQSQLPRKESETKQVCKETPESSSGTVESPLTKRVDPSEEDKACVRSEPVNEEENIVQLTVDVDRVEIREDEESEYVGFGSDVREVGSGSGPGSGSDSLDIGVVGQPVNQD